MKKRRMLLLGDSIMCGAKGVHGYGWHIQQKHFSDIIVELPRDNCQDARYLLSYFDEIITTKEDVFDVVYWNNGLWDVLHFVGSPVKNFALKLLKKHCNIRSSISLRFRL